MQEQNLRVLASVILDDPIVTPTTAPVPAPAGARSRCGRPSAILCRRSLPAAGATSVSAHMRMQSQLDAWRAIQQHAPQLITVSWLAARSAGAELAARAIRGKQLVDEIDVLEGARDDKLGQVGAGVVLDDERDGRVVEQAPRH